MPEGPAHTFGESAWPVVRVAMHRKHSDEEFRAYLDGYGKYLEQNERYGVIFDVSPKVGMLPMTQVRMQTAWMKISGARLKEVCAGVAFVLTSPLHRGALRAILSMQGMPVDFTVVDSVDAAQEWFGK